jgi:hypothetical protein
MALTWPDLQNKFHGNAQAHWNLCESFGLACPFDVFEQLFFDHHGDEDFASLLGEVDFSRVVWRERTMSGAQLQRVAIPRAYQTAVDEARVRTGLVGVEDERDEVIEQWAEEGTWLRSPILVAGSLLGSGVEWELLVGFTRLGNLLGLLDANLVPAGQKHSVWVGEVDRD